MQGESCTVLRLKLMRKLAMCHMLLGRDCYCLLQNITILIIKFDMTISTKQTMPPQTLFLRSYARFSSLFFTPIVMMSPLFFQRYCYSSISLQSESRCVSVNHLMKQMWLHTGRRQTASLLYG